VSSKYKAIGTELVVSDLAGNSVTVSEHALNRWRERTPADADISIREAWRHGERVKHPPIASDGCDDTCDLARVFRHSDGWSAVFIVLIDHHSGEWGRSAERCVATVLTIDKYDHEPTRAYLREYGPHDGGCDE
jgi:hypothetical protein